MREKEHLRYQVYIAVTVSIDEVTGVLNVADPMQGHNYSAAVFG